MNYLKKKLKPLTAGLTATNQNQKQKDLEDDLYDEYVVEAPPHPSELLALGIEPSEIDVNDPDKLRELYRKAKEEGKDKKTNSILLAKQRQKEEIEEKKKSREEWKFFNNLTSRVEQVVKESQKNLDQLRESSAIESLAEPDYELRLTPDQVFKSTTTVKQEKEGENSWVDFGDESGKSKGAKEERGPKSKSPDEELDEFGCPKRKLSIIETNPVAEVLLEDFGIDLRTAEQKRAIERKKQQQELEKKQLQAKEALEAKSKAPDSCKGLDIDIKAAARPRPRPGKQQETTEVKQQETTGDKTQSEPGLDPFDTSFVAPVVSAAGQSLMLEKDCTNQQEEEPKLGSEQPKHVTAMNRHTSNPFLSDWDTEADNAISSRQFGANPPTGVNNNDSQTVDTNNNNNNNERSSTFTRRSSSGQAEFGSHHRAGLLRRNMSSFEAASLQLEQQQQMQQENGSIPSTQKDLIAQMTADFQSAMQTNDKQFECIDGFNPFDPFETIVDDDTSLPSPALSAGHTKSIDDRRDDEAHSGRNGLTKDDNSNETTTKHNNSNKNNAHDSIDDDDEELVSTPVRNIKAHDSVGLGQPTDAPNQGGANETSPAREDTDSMAKAYMLSSLLASAEAGGQQGVDEVAAPPPPPLPADERNHAAAAPVGGQDRSTNESPTNPTHVIKGSPNSAGEGTSDRPVSFFDPFETVIDKDALTSLMNDAQQQQSSTNQNPKEPGEQDDDNDAGEYEPSPVGGIRVGESISVETLIENEARFKASGEGELNSDASASKEGEFGDVASKQDQQQRQQQQQQQAQQASKSSRLAQYDSSMAMGRPTGRSLRADPAGGGGGGGAPAAPPVTPMKRSTARPQRQKVSSSQKDDGDSSDSSEEDDRIQIVIKTRDASKSENNSQPAIVPLLPPPPSKSTIKQIRERGQVEDMPSPIMGYKTRHERKRNADSSSSDSDDDNHHQYDKDRPASATNKQEKEDDAPADQARGKVAHDEGNDGDDDDEEEGPDDGQFVIAMKHSDDEEGDDYGKPETPLYDDDTSYELEDFPAKYDGPGWEMMLRYPPKKKLTSNRFWKKIFVKLVQVPPVADSKSTVHQHQHQQQQQQQQPDAEPQICWALQIFDKAEDKKPLQEIPIQATYTVSEISSQLFDQFGKIFTIKLQYIFYKERVGVRQGQLARFIHGGHIGSSTTSGGHGVDPISIGAIKRMGAPIEHSPQISQIIKLGCTSYEDIKGFKECLEDCLFRIPIHRDRALSTYKTEEVQMAARDETFIELNQIGTITRQMARVRLFFLSFLNGNPTVEVGVNDSHRQGREVVGRMDILPVVTEEWIRLEAWELHSTVAVKEFEDPNLRIIKLVPPDATFFEVMRFRVRPPRNRELPLQISANMSVTRTKVSINCEVMVPGCISRKHGQIPCENIAIRLRIPECWIYFFREEKHFRMGSKKSVNRRPGKVKGIERFLGGGGLQDFNDQSSLIEVTSGQAKYEHHHGAIVWRAARWPKESQSAYVQNTMKIRLPLTAYDKMPDNFYEYVHVEYTMPATTVSHTTLRSISVNPIEDEPPEKYVKYSAKYEYKVKMRLSVNLGTRPTTSECPEVSPIVIMKQPDLHGDLQREEDSDDDDEDDDDDDQHKNDNDNDNVVHNDHRSD